PPTPASPPALAEAPPEEAPPELPLTSPPAPGPPVVTPPAPGPPAPGAPPESPETTLPPVPSLPSRGLPSLEQAGARASARPREKRRGVEWESFTVLSVSRLGREPVLRAELQGGHWCVDEGPREMRRRRCLTAYSQRKNQGSGTKRVRPGAHLNLERNSKAAAPAARSVARARPCCALGGPRSRPLRARWPAR